MKRAFAFVAVAGLSLALPIFAQMRGGGIHAGGAGGRGAGMPGPGFSSQGPNRGGGGPANGGFSGNGGGGNLGPTPFSAGTYGAGFGSVFFPSGVRSFGSVVSPIYSKGTSFANRLGNVVSGNGSVYGVGPGNNSGFIGGRAAVYPRPVARPDFRTERHESVG